MAVLDDVGVDQAHVVGYSMGGWMADANGHHYFSVPGDHLTAFYLQGRDAAARMAAFFSDQRSGRKPD